MNLSRSSRSSRSLGALVLAAPLLSLSLTVSRDSFAQTKPAPTEDRAKVEEARGHFNRGVQLFKDADARAALVEFNRAYALAPNYRVLYNMGQAELEVQDYAGALNAFTRYLAEGGKEVPAARKKEVDSEIARLADRVARLTLKVNMPGAEVSVDDVVVGTSPFPEAIVVSAGRRKITATLAPSPPVTKVIDVAGRDALEVEITLSEPVAAVVQAPATPYVAPKAPPPPPPQNHAPFWISLGVTGAFGVATLTTGVLSLGAKSTLDERLNTFPTDDASVASARSQLKTMALVTDICAVGTILGAGVTTYFAFKSFRTPSASVDVGFVPGGVVAAGRF